MEMLKKIGAELSKLIKDTLTGIDNNTYDIGRIGGIAGLSTFLGLSIYQVVIKGIVFDMVQFGTAFGLVIVAVGAAIAVKSKTEPTGKDEAPK